MSTHWGNTVPPPHAGDRHYRQQITASSGKITVLRRYRRSDCLRQCDVTGPPSANLRASEDAAASSIRATTEVRNATSMSPRPNSRVRRAPATGGSAHLSAHPARPELFRCASRSVRAPPAAGNITIVNGADSPARRLATPPVIYGIHLAAAVDARDPTLTHPPRPRLPPGGMFWRAPTWNAPV